MSKVIVVDFDGTCVTHEFPKVGKDIGAVLVLKKLVDNGHKLVLFTMRADRPVGGDTGDAGIQDVTGTFLTDAVNWFKENGIELWGVQTNPDQNKWTTSPKAYGHLYIDDAALGCPLIMDAEVSERPYVNWEAVEKYLVSTGYIQSEGFEFADPEEFFESIFPTKEQEFYKGYYEGMSIESRYWDEGEWTIKVNSRGTLLLCVTGNKSFLKSTIENYINQYR